VTTIIRAIFVGVALLGGASAARADCDIGQLAAVTGVVSLDYDGFSTSDASAPILSRAVGNADCAGVRVTFEFFSEDGRLLRSGEGLELRSGGENLLASLSGQGQSASVIARQGMTEVRLNGVGAPPLNSLNLVIPRGQRVPPGVYQGQFKLVTEALDEDGAPISRSESFVTVAANVQPSVGLSAAWGTELDLGTISSDARAVTPLRFRAYANTRYEIVLTSDNDFNLVRPGRSFGLPIVYSPILSGETLSEGAERGVNYAAPPSIGGFTDHTLNVVVPALVLRPAGDYEDFITVTIRPSLS